MVSVRSRADSAAVQGEGTAVKQPSLTYTVPVMQDVQSVFYVDNHIKLHKQKNNN